VNWELQKQLNPAIGPTVDIFEAVEWLRSDDDGGEWTIDSFSPIHQLNQGVQQAETGFERRDAKATAEGIHNSEKGFLATAMLFLGPGAGGAEAARGIARPKGVPADWVPSHPRQAAARGSWILRTHTTRCGSCPATPRVRSPTRSDHT